MSEKLDSSLPEDSGPEPLPRGPFSIFMDRVWWSAVSLMIAPVLLAWLVRAAAFATDCQPGPTSCFDTLFGNALGPALKDFLELSWLVGAGFVLTPTLTTIAALAAALAARPLRAGISALFLPLLALLLPILLVMASRPDSCVAAVEVVPANCALWGSAMEQSFERADTAKTLVFGYLLPAGGGAVGAFVLGWITRALYRQFARP